MKEYQSYIQAWQERFQQDSRLAVERKKEARIAAEKMASILIRNYKVKDVYFFGSLIIPEKEFSVDSDIDLGVAGLAAEDYYQVWREIESLSEFRVDLVDLDRCSREFRMKVLSEGRRYRDNEEPISPLN